MNGIRTYLHGLSRYFRPDVFFRLLPYIRPYKLAVILAVLTTIIEGGLRLLEPWSMKILVDNGLRGEHMPGWVERAFPLLTPTHPYAIIVFAVVAGIVLWLAETMVSSVGDYLKSRVDARMTLNLKADLFNHLQRLSLSYHDQTQVGDSMYRIDNDTEFISALNWGNFRQLMISVITLSGVLWIVIRLDWQLALLALAAGPIIYASIGFYAKHFKDKSKRVKRMESASQTIVQEVLSCLRVVKAFGQEDREQRRFEDQSWAALRARLRLMIEQNLFSSGMGLITRLDLSLILLVGGFHVFQGRLTIGELLVILSYVSQIHSPLESIGETLTEMQLCLASAERVLEVLDVKPEVQHRPGAKVPARIQGSIAFQDVSFAYRHGHPVLHNISFTAQPNEVVACVGPTGAGKTTIANLIARFYDPVSGRVTLDSYELPDLALRVLRSNIAVVIQEPILMAGTIGENIAYGRPDAKMNEVVAAARAANAHDFITALPDGYESQVGERGVRLSGGERQRIAIARAFLKDAPVLILDEPTSSVDSRTEMVILDALDRLMVGRTTFIIAHRLSTIRYADQILVINNGRIIERGTHAELILSSGLYAQLYRIQSGALRSRKKRGSTGA
jgi:ABC-type multidrug transport system fused ATPase/permease subunit